ncbi:glycosyl transferase, partial [Streptomyces sp. NPDC049577]
MAISASAARLAATRGRSRASSPGDGRHADRRTGGPPAAATVRGGVPPLGPPAGASGRESYDYARFSRLAGELTDPPADAYRVRYRRLLAQGPGRRPGVRLLVAAAP